MNSRSMIGQITFATILGCLLSALLGATVIAYSVVQTEQRARDNLTRTVQFTPPANQVIEGVPYLNQASIDKAVAYFKIKVPSNVYGPAIDLNLTDRGLTVRRGALSQIHVSIGPEAFSSWAMLASTISHEVEVHCRQNFFAIHLMDMAGLDGTGQAEREAYSHELSGAHRFGLSPYDQDLIRSTADYFYPDKRARFARQIIPVKFWIDGMSAAKTKNRM